MRKQKKFRRRTHCIWEIRMLRSRLPVFCAKTKQKKIKIFFVFGGPGERHTHPFKPKLPNPDQYGTWHRTDCSTLSTRHTHATLLLYSKSMKSFFTGPCDEAICSTTVTPGGSSTCFIKPFPCVNPTRPRSRTRVL